MARPYRRLLWLLPHEVAAQVVGAQGPVELGPYVAVVVPFAALELAHIVEAFVGPDAAPPIAAVCVAAAELDPDLAQAFGPEQVAG